MQFNNRKQQQMVQMVQYLEHCHVLTSCSFNLRSTENEKTHVEIGNLGVEAHDKLRRKQLPANQNSSRSLGLRFPAGICMNLLQGLLICFPGCFMFKILGHGPSAISIFAHPVTCVPFLTSCCIHVFFKSFFREKHNQKDITGQNQVYKQYVIMPLQNVPLYDAAQ